MNLYFGIYDKIRHNATRKAVRNKSLKRINNTVQLTKEQKKKILDFYAPYEKITTLFHQMYFEKTGVFSEKFIPVDVYINVIDEYFNARKESRFIDNKCYYKRLFPGIKQPEYAVAKIGNFWFDENEHIITYDKVKEIISNEDELFLKVALESSGGKGISYISKEKGNMIEQFENFNSKYDFIAQRPIHQHKDISAINDSSVNTIRIMSLLNETEVKIYSVIMRIGQKGSKVDNASSGGVTIGVTEDGKLKKYAHKYSGESFSEHPTNGFVFEDYQIPSFEDAKELVKRAHPMVPHFRLVSWDICIDEYGDPVLLEANLCKGGIDIYEFNNGPIFGEDTKKILDEVYGKTK